MVKETKGKAKTKTNIETINKENKTK